MDCQQNDYYSLRHEGVQMVPYRLPQEKQTLLHYATLLNDQVAKRIINEDVIKTAEDAIKFAQFFWKMVDESNVEDKKSGNSSEHILEKIIITLMAYFRSNGFEDEWERVSDER